MKKLISIVIIIFTGVGIFMFNIFKKEQQANSVSKENVLEFVENNPGVIIDVRTQDEYDSGHLAEADLQFDLMSGEFAQQLDSLDKSKTYYLYCRSGNRSGKASRLMKDKGFENVYNIGGYSDLKNQGFETTR